MLGGLRIKIDFQSTNELNGVCRKLENGEGFLGGDSWQAGGLTCPAPHHERDWVAVSSPSPTPSARQGLEESRARLSLPYFQLLFMSQVPCPARSLWAAPFSGGTAAGR